MNLYLDTEFTALQQNGELISLALVDEHQHYFYAEFTDYDPSTLTAWHQKNVIQHLLLGGVGNKSLPAKGQNLRGNKQEISEALKSWLSKYQQLEIWTDAVAYDWVFFCELFGGALHLPKNIFYLPFDLVTLLKIRGMDPNITRETVLGNWQPPEGLAKHNALYDAMLLRTIHQQLEP